MGRPTLQRPVSTEISGLSITNRSLPGYRRSSAYRVAFVRFALTGHIHSINTTLTELLQ